jgi:stearoyl-CoA desaturase (delta-9 desaturase)
MSPLERGANAWGIWRDAAATAPFAALHLAALAVFFLPFSWSLVALCAVSYAVRMFGVTAGYHRYFSHRSYKLGRPAQFLLAVLAQTSGQKGVLWWAAHHRDHHRHADGPRDVHSPREGFWWAHVGWVLSDAHVAYDPRRVADFARFPELRWLDRHHWVPTVGYGAGIALIGGWPVFVWAYLVSTVLLYHATFAINSIAHIWGSRAFDTRDDSRNNWWLALLTLGEGWHNNHHHCMSSSRQGRTWREFDATYVVLRALAAIGIARDLRPFVARTSRGGSPVHGDRGAAQGHRAEGSHADARGVAA